MKLLIDDKTGRQFNLNANEACVFAAILKCSKSGRGWYANYRDLADAMPFVISRQTVTRAVEKLLNLGLIERRDDSLFACVQNGQSDDQNGLGFVQNGPNDDQIELPPNNPLIYNNKMERNENIACAHLRTAKCPLPASFEKLVKVYTLRVGNHKMDDKARDNCLRAWTSQKYPEWKQDMLIEAIERGAEDICKPTLEWTLDRFDPQPTNYNHRELEPGVKYYTARWDGKWGTYAEEDVKRFNLEIAPQPKKSNKQI